MCVEVRCLFMFCNSIGREFPASPAAPCPRPDGTRTLAQIASPRARARTIRLTTIAFAAGAFAAGMWVAPMEALAGDFYLRGGIGLDRSDRTAFSDVDCSSAAPAALYGCGTGDDGAPYRSAGDFGTVPAIELGLGHADGPVRYEVLVEYRPDYSFEGRANFLAPGSRVEVAAKLSSVTGMLAGFVDLDGMGLPMRGRFAPFVGAAALASSIPGSGRRP